MLDDRKEDKKMARQEKELPIADVIVSYVGTEDDFMKFLRAVVPEYPVQHCIIGLTPTIQSKRNQ